jgi:hypothetical protein
MKAARDPMAVNDQSDFTLDVERGVNPGGRLKK